MRRGNRRISRAPQGYQLAVNPSDTYVGPIQLFLNEDDIVTVPRLLGQDACLPFVELMIARPKPTAGQMADAPISLNSQRLDHPVVYRLHPPKYAERSINLTSTGCWRRMLS